MNPLNLLIKVSIGQSIFFFIKTVRIHVKWYFNEILGYLIMSFTSIPVIANN